MMLNTVLPAALSMVSMLAVAGDPVTFDTRWIQSKPEVRISTLVKPYNRTTANELESKGLVIDPAMIPILPRLLPLRPGSTFSFTSLDPVTNSLGIFTLKVTAEEMIQKVACHRAETTSFEGNSIVWVEKAAPHRIFRIETPGQAGANELIH